MSSGVLTIRLDPQLADRLRVAALVTDTSSVELVRNALDGHLTDLEKSAVYKRRRADLIIATTPVETKPARRARLAAAPPVPPAEEGNL